MDEEKEFTIRDRRAATSDAGEEQPHQGIADTQQTENAGHWGQRQEAETDQAPDFSTFVISLASSAQVNLGAMPHPETNQTSQNFPAAKQMIDILGMLKEKTTGNLSETESTLLDRVLFNLR
ncbi:MAG: DUF1844 domain-containing protein, partial [Nitrospirae bacterium]|nr:DUF1844 domain-containing protein [Nitrospirota bacterium]